MLQTDVVVIGAGPAGSVAAAGLRNQGFDVLMLEKTRFPRFIIGESLLPRTNEILSKAGMLEDTEKAGFIIKHGAVFWQGDQRVQFNFRETSAEGWGHSWQVPRDDFDTVLARSAADKGADLRFEHEVTDVAFDDDGVTVRFTDLRSGEAQQARAGFVIDGSGYGRVLARLLDLEETSDLKYRKALFNHVTGDIRPTGDDEGYIWIVTLPQGGWIWVIPFSNGKTSVGVVGEPALFDAESGTDEEVLRKLLLQEPSLKDRLAHMQFVWDQPRVLEGYSKGIKQLYGHRYILTGNASEFLDPVFSSGVTVAVESAWRAQELVGRYLRGEDVDFDKEYRQYIMSGVDAFRAYVKSWYSGDLQKIFLTNTSADNIKKKICSVLAGYAWDDTNPFALYADRSLQSMAEMVSP